MKKLLATILTVFTLLALSGCGGSSSAPTMPGGFGGNPWDRSLPEQQAQQIPGTLDATPQPPAMPATATTAAAPVKIALLLPLSGPNAAVGEAIMNAAQLALFDVGTVNFELMPRDTQGTAYGASVAARSIINEGAQLILGPLFAEEVRAVAPIAQSANINTIAFTTDFKLAGGNTFVMGFLPFGQVQRVIGYAAAKGLRNIGVIAPQSDYGDAVLNALNAYGPRAGLTIVDSLRFAPGNTALGPAVQRFARYDSRKQPDGSFARPPFDAIFLPVGGADAQNISAMLTAYEIDPVSVKRLGTGLWDDPVMARDKNLAGGWFAAPDPRARQIFENKYRDAYGTTPPRLASLGYDATALAAVLSRGGNAIDRTAITNANGFAGIDGIFRFRADGLAERGLAVLELRNGQSAVIDPAQKTFQAMNQ